MNVFFRSELNSYANFGWSARSAETKQQWNQSSIVTEFIHDFSHDIDDVAIGIGIDWQK